MSVHRNAADTTVPKKATRKRAPRRNGPVISVKPNLAAWNLALEIAEGNVKRLETLDANTILVRNHANP